MSTPPPPAPPRELVLPVAGLKCPRCESTNTKFCYYNNYSLSQPRHFCNSCRRHWTRGGTQRTIPIGSPSRKIKKPTSSSPSSSSSSSSLNLVHPPPPPPQDNFKPPSTGAALDLLKNFNPSFGDGGTSSIESLKMELLHWKLLQQQRMAVLYGGVCGDVGGGGGIEMINLVNGDGGKSYQNGESSGGGVGPSDIIASSSAHAQFPNPNFVFFQNLEGANNATKHAQNSEDGSQTNKGSVATEWLFRGGSCGGSNGDNNNNNNESD